METKTAFLSTIIFDEERGVGHFSFLFAAIAFVVV